MKSKCKNIIGPRVRRLRKAAGLTCERLAGHVAQQGGKLTAREIDRIERRECRVKDHEVLHLARLLGVKVQELFPSR